jgi:RNA polymerase-binding transcription factor DksA
MSDKTRYSDEELAEFDQLLDEKIANAQKQLDYYLNQIKLKAESDDSKLKGLEDAAGAQQVEQDQIRAARQTKMLKHLDNAKLRIKNKVYGICRESGTLISKERLKAVPHATLSIKAKQAKLK